jgi:hypothetical protein
MKRPQAHDISACGPAQAGASLNVTAGQTVNLVERVGTRWPWVPMRRWPRSVKARGKEGRRW